MNKTCYCLIGLFIILYLRCGAQDVDLFPNREDQKQFESGKLLMEERLHSLAYEHFNKLLVRHPRDLYIKYLTGICGIYINSKHEEAFNYLSEVKLQNPKAADIDYYIALLYHRTYKFSECIELASSLLENPETDSTQRKRLNEVIEHSKNGLSLISHKTNARITNLGAGLNSEDDEYSPVLTADEETIFFTYRGKLSKGGLRDIYDRPNKYGYYYEDVYMARKVDGVWQKPVALDNINTESHEAVLAISNDGQQLFIFRAAESDGGDIYLSRFDGNEYGKPHRLKGDVNTENWEGSLSISGDQKKIIFSSDRPGGLGGKDLYEAVKTGDNTWGRVKNLGSHINTPLDEDAPFIHPDGRSLVFSSQGHNSVGDYDIFISELDPRDSSWKDPVNAGYPLNTPGDDIFYTLSADGRRGYYASEKDEGFGSKDIYVEEPTVFTKSQNLTLIKGHLMNNNTPYSGEITVLSGNDAHNFGSFMPDPVTGNYHISLPAGEHYKIVFKNPSDSQQVVDLNMDRNTACNELTVDADFGGDKSTPAQRNIVLGPLPTLTAQPVTEIVMANDNPKTIREAKKTRQQLMALYGETKVSGLKYQIQVGAYRKPQNYDRNMLQQLCKVKRQGSIEDGINLLVADKEFDTWKEADLFLGKVRQAGQKDAFITSTLNGKRYYIRELVELGVWNQPGTIASR